MAKSKDEFRIIDREMVPAAQQMSAVAKITDLVMAGGTVFVPRGGPKPTLHRLNESGLLRRQRAMVLDDVEGTAYWAIPRA